jgi:hypothetical protein
LFGLADSIRLGLACMTVVFGNLMTVMIGNLITMVF